LSEILENLETWSTHAHFDSFISVDVSSCALSFKSSLSAIYIRSQLLCGYELLVLNGPRYLEISTQQIIL